jgi:FkbM family methyltransferase
MTFFLPILKKSGHLNDVHVTICNVGSRKKSAEDDYGTKGWEIFAPNLNIYGFDADADACDEANNDIASRNVNWNEFHLPVAIGKSTEQRTLYVTKDPMCSSLLRPNEAFLANFSHLPEQMNLDFSLEIETTTLDEFCKSENIDEIDFLQIDVQGAELDVIRGAETKISNVLGLQTEVSFSHLYVEQPLFADIDSYLRKHNFSFFDLHVGYRLRRTSIRETHRQGQLLWGDAFYLKNFIDFETKMELLDPKKIFKLACVADVMGFIDYAVDILKYLTIEYSEVPEFNFADVIINGLAGVQQLDNTALKDLEIVRDIRDYLSKDAIAKYNL